MTGDSAARPPSKGAGLKLSREMKLALATLLLLALLGAWFVWTGNRSADDLAGAATPQSDPAQTEGAQSGAAPTPAAEASATPEATADSAAPASGAPVEVAPSGQGEVPVIPAFGTLDGPDAEGPQPEALPAPGGINPDTALAALPGVNPFRPLALEGEGQTPDGQSAAAPVTPPAAPVAQTPAVSAAPATTSSDRASTSSGPLALSPLPGTGVSGAAAPGPVAVPSPRVTGGAFPTPTLPGANVPAPVAVRPSSRPASAAKPSSVRVTRPAAVPPASRPTAPAPVRVLPAPTPVRPPAAPAALPAPARPPVAGVSVPPSPDLNGTLAAAPEQPGTAASAGGAAPTALPTPGTPQPITQLGAGGVESGAAGPLATLVQTRELAFDAVVLGPVNTAILRSKGGFVVVAQGQTLPDSDVVVREISAERVTLELGPETQILDLNSPTSTQGEP
ncbi:hypothetical protein [Deinococcus budaensis]|uniref:Uncharacterized protein n=1 Tax=Deinococcus budaensis TaxID=1665626 RepID=A0A7W8LPI8_9DEIO|nr:hypothetical protein [Deinococcus budaensis]MBB5233585.1 hypothetical protein [Deinococcus budaensis]